MRRRFLVLTVALLVAATPLRAGRPPAITISAITWPGADGRLVHGYMAVPAKARGRQPRVLVLAGSAAGLQAEAHALVDALARAGFVACTPRGDEPAADLVATLAWLRSNRYATGRVAVAALGADALVRLPAPSGLDGLLLFGDTIFAPPPDVPALGLPLPGPDAELPAEARAFLKEHLR